MMEKMRLRNFLSVTTSVTVSEAHSVVRMKTPRMHTYLKLQLKVCNKILRKWTVDSFKYDKLHSRYTLF